MEITEVAAQFHCLIIVGKVLKIPIVHLINKIKKQSTWEIYFM